MIPGGAARALLHYLLLAALFCGLTVVAVPLYKYAAAEKAVGVAAKLRTDGRHGAAAARLDAARAWAVPHPELYLRLQCERIRCLTGEGEVRRAETLAEQMLTHPFSADASTAKAGKGSSTGVQAAAADEHDPWAAGWLLAEPLVETIQGPARLLVNEFLVRRSDATLSPWSGYEALIDELSRNSSPSASYEAAQRLLALHPDNPVVTVASAVPKPPTAARPVSSPTVSTPEPKTVSEQGWGIVRAERGRVFSGEGKFLSNLQLGAAVSISRRISSPAGDLAVCSAISGTGVPKRFVMKVEDLVIRQGAYTSAAEEEKAIVRRKAELEGRIARAKREATLRRNPYYGDYERVSNDYRAFWKKVRDLQAKRDASSGAEHVEYSDQLQLLKGRDIEIAQELKTIRAKFDEWNKLHADEPAADSSTAELQTEVASLDARLREMERTP